jgi:hypothetical protein
MRDCPRKGQLTFEPTCGLRTASVDCRFEAGGAAALYRQSGPGSNTEERRALLSAATGAFGVAVAALDEGKTVSLTPKD